MNCARRSCVHAFLFVFFVCSQSIAAFCKDGKESKSLIPENNRIVSVEQSDHFQWHEHNKLSWDDFRGPVKSADDESAAATHCGIGFKTNINAPGGKPSVIVYNTFYTTKSWVRPDAKVQSILEHEQGHFDLCEIYTRMLRDRMNNFDFNVPDVKQALMSVYTEINNMYESRQQAYEQETTHGTNITQQKKWRQMMTQELRS